MDSLFETRFAFSVIIQIIIQDPNMLHNCSIHSSTTNWTKTKSTFGAESHTGVILEMAEIPKVPMVDNLRWLSY